MLALHEYGNEPVRQQQTNGAAPAGSGVVLQPTAVGLRGAAARHFAKVASCIDTLPSHAEVRMGGTQVGTRGFFFAPTVITGARQSDRIVQEEVFGPVLTVQSFQHEAEAVAMANGAPCSLAAGVWMRDHGTADRLSRDLDFGCVWTNAHLPFVSEMPHGGFGASGYGKDLSGYGFDDYTRIKHVMILVGHDALQRCRGPREPPPGSAGAPSPTFRPCKSGVREAVLAPGVGPDRGREPTSPTRGSSMPHRDTTARRPPLPTGWRRLAARLPILLFRIGLGFLFGKRLLLLHHVGRISGLGRMVVPEVVSYDPANASWIIASGFGPKADWYQNLREQPKTLTQFGNRPHAVTAHFLTPDEGADIMADYARRHPRTAHRLCAYLGLPVDGGEAAYRDAGRAIPFVRLDTAVRHPIPSLGEGAPRAARHGGGGVPASLVVSP